ncbi:hypothetical protein G6F32_014948 [Rhizopus arrhizus]|nr:hypothetical protein G6F32_014948 [Rhizopus arrhizus]
MKNNTSRPVPPPSSTVISGESNQFRRAPWVRPSTSITSAGNPRARPTPLNWAKRSRRIGSCGRPQPTITMPATQNGTICQNANCQPACSTHSAASGVPMLGPNVAVSA